MPSDGNECPEAVPAGIQILNETDVTIGSRLLKQDSRPDSSRLDAFKPDFCRPEPADSLLSLTPSGSALSMPPIQNMRLSDRSNAFKSYAGPLTLGQPVEQQALSDSLSPFDDFPRPRDVKRDLKFAQQVKHHNIVLLAKDAPPVTK